MRRFFVQCIVSAVAIACGCASSTAQAPDPDRVVAEREPLDDVLRRLERAGDGLRTFSAQVRYTTIADLGGAFRQRVGTLVFEVEPRDDGAPRRRFGVEFVRVWVGDQIFDDENAQQAITFDGRWFAEKFAGQRQINRYEIVAEGEIADPFEMGTGFFPPLPIGQRADDLQRRYVIRLVSATDGLEPDPDLDPELDKAEYDHAAQLMRFAEGATQLLLVPRAGLGDERFAEIRLWYKSDASGRLLPRMSRTVDRRGDVSIVELAHPLSINEPIRGELLSTAIPEGWAVTERRLQDGPGEPAGGNG
ncbi:MAG: hypothetical protein AAFX79_02035 [Planctomycetota bacterium]